MPKFDLSRCAPCVAALSLLTSGPAMAADVSHDAIDACIDALRAEVAAAGGGTVLRTEFSEAASLVMLEDGSGVTWRCLVSNDGRDPYLTRQEGATSGAATSAEPTTRTEVVHFAPGTSGQEMSGTLSPGSSVNYVLGASEGQDLSVFFTGTDTAIQYQIFNPDGSFLLDMISSETPYGGQLWQSGDHVIEVINRGSSDAGYSVSMEVE